MSGDNRGVLAGNVWVLVGAVLYLLEWVAIIWAGAVGVGAQVTRGTTAADVLDTYAGHQNAVYAMAGWFAVVLLGRVLLFIGLRQALGDSGYRHPLLDFAVAASAVSVTLEIASYGLAASAAASADAGDRSLTVAIDAAGAGLNLMISGGLGVAIVCTTFAMWRSGLFKLNSQRARSGLWVGNHWCAGDDRAVTPEPLRRAGVLPIGLLDLDALGRCGVLASQNTTGVRPKRRQPVKVVQAASDAQAGRSSIPPMPHRANIAGSRPLVARPKKSVGTFGLPHRRGDDSL